MIKAGNLIPKATFIHGGLKMQPITLKKGPSASLVKRRFDGFPFGNVYRVISNSDQYNNYTSMVANVEVRVNGIITQGANMIKTLD